MNGPIPSRSSKGRASPPGSPDSPSTACRRIWPTGPPPTSRRMEKCRPRWLRRESRRRSTACFTSPAPTPGAPPGRATSRCRFSGPPFVPSLTLTTTSAVTRNPQGGPLCAWSQELTLQETSGFLFLLTGLSAGGVNLSSSLQSVFGTTRLAPYSALRGRICWSEATPTGGVNYQVTAESEIGTTVTAKAASSLVAAAPNPPSLAVSPAVVEMLAADSSEAGSGTASIDFNGAPANWTAAIVPARAAGWLKISPLSGAGAAQLNLTASGSGLSNGVYDATILVHSPGASPEVAAIRVVFVVGASGEVTIDGVSNAASGGPVLAPGAMAIVQGSNLAASRQQTGKLPLALSLGGVSATVNGITAPLYSIAPDTVAIQIPYETGLGDAVLGINNNGRIASYLFPVQAAAPA